MSDEIEINFIRVNDKSKNVRFGGLGSGLRSQLPAEVWSELRGLSLNFALCRHLIANGVPDCGDLTKCY